jgi:hypothetical protein
MHRFVEKQQGNSIGVRRNRLFYSFGFLSNVWLLVTCTSQSLNSLVNKQNSFDLKKTIIIGDRTDESWRTLTNIKPNYKKFNVHWIIIKI